MQPIRVTEGEYTPHESRHCFRLYLANHFADVAVAEGVDIRQVHLVRYFPNLECNVYVVYFETQRGIKMITERQQEILQLIADGYKSPEIAKKLGIRNQTVKNIVHRAYQGLGARGPGHAIAIALRKGLIT